jgi:hypothetical protein
MASARRRKVEESRRATVAKKERFERFRVSLLLRVMTKLLFSGNITA